MDLGHVEPAEPPQAPRESLTFVKTNPRRKVWLNDTLPLRSSNNSPHEEVFLVRGTQCTWCDGNDGPILSDLCLKSPLTPPLHPPWQESSSLTFA